MRILTDPNGGQGKLVKLLIKYYTKLCILMYISSIVWFCLLAHSSVSLSTKFSENALLPGLVTSEFNEESTARLYYEELLDEMKTYKDSIPYPWLLAKFRQLGLDTYSHNYTLNLPLGKPQKFTGKNVYGILRAPRAASTESVVLSVPYRPPSGICAPTAPSIAIMLAFAKFANRKNYWAKDIIFLITEHEHIGIQAWLEAYHSTNCGASGTLEHGDLRGRAGAIQAAINLEIHDIKLGKIDVKIEGLNGHLPNLDLVTLVNRLCIKEGIQIVKNRGLNMKWKNSFRTMMSMIATQSTGVPNGNHGLFHRFGIEAVTMEGFKGNNDGFFTLGLTLEGIFRSLNNLLERFHQSYFFYLLPASDRFVSIGLYIPVIICMAGTLFIKPCAYWYKLKGDALPDKIKRKIYKEKIGKKKKSKNSDHIDLFKVGVIVLLTHTLGICVMNSPKYLTQIGLQYGYPTHVSVYFGLGIISLILLLLPFVVPGKNTEKNMHVLNIFANLEMGTALIALGMLNFSLALLSGVLYVPIVLLISPIKSSIRSKIQKLLWIIVHPFIVMTIVVLIYTYFTFPNTNLKEVFFRGIMASQQALLFSILDSLIYGNWLYNVATAIILSNWLCLWFVMFPHFNTKENISLKKKLN